MKNSGVLATAIAMGILISSVSLAHAQIKLPLCNEDRVLSHMSGQMDNLVDQTLNGLWNYILVNMGDDLNDVQMEEYRIYEIGSAELTGVSTLSKEARSTVCRATVYAIKIATGIRERWGIVQYTIFINPQAQEGISIETNFPSEIEEREDS